MQHFVEHRPEALDGAIGLGAIRWLSPLRRDDFAEYRDQAFLDLLGVRLAARPSNRSGRHAARSGTHWA